MIFARKPARQKLGPELGIWHKIGYTFCILLIALLRLAELIILSHQSTWTMLIVNAICGIGKFENKVKLFRVLLSGIIYQYLPSGDGIAFPVHSINDHHYASIFCILQVLFC